MVWRLCIDAVTDFSDGLASTAVAGGVGALHLAATAVVGGVGFCVQQCA